MLIGHSQSSLIPRQGYFLYLDGDFIRMATNQQPVPAEVLVQLLKVTISSHGILSRSRKWGSHKYCSRGHFRENYRKADPI